MDQCLHSVERAIRGIEADVWVVDNNSVDDSMEMVRSKYPWVKTIDNAENVGFAKANNQAARASKSDYILLLNPDTLLPEDNLEKALGYMDEHPTCGALGVRMHDGSGTFLPESKRGLPSPWVAFYKIVGLSSLFPKSEKFAKYHLGHLSNHQNHKVEILAGAYMLMRRDAWDKAGELDETYFMYGEDIDLSHSISLAGYEVHYLADAPILHYKGESTKKGSLNYVFMFYNAMLIFARKHLSKGYAQVFSILIRFAIYMRAGLSVVKRIATKVALPLTDLILFTAGMQFIIRYWEHNHRFIQGGSYPDFYKWGITPLYGLLWVVGLLLLGGYKKPIKLNRILMGLALGTTLIFGLYAFSPEEFRFSRALIALGAGWMTFEVILLRFSLSMNPSSNMGFWKLDQRRIGYIGKEENSLLVKNLCKESGQKIDLFETIPAEQISESAKALDLHEIVLDSSKYSYSEILNWMIELHPMGVKIFIAYPEEGWIIGSDSIHTRGEAIGAQSYALNDKNNLRSKRLFDVLVVLFLWILTPIAIWMPRLRKFWWSSFEVFFGKKTWVGYCQAESELPAIRDGVIPVKFLTDKTLAKKVDQAYARTADSNTDASIMLSYLRRGI